MQPNSRDKNETKNKYVPVKLLGEGSFGKAYLVENTQEKTYAVIKTIDIENMSESERKEAYFEAKILQKLDHQNIIKFKDVFFMKKPKFTLHIVMDYADGGDLQSRIKSQKSKNFPENQILDWFTQICLAIKHIHDRKILHRDIKSQNIFLTKHGLAKLGDFGISKCLNFTLDKVSTVVGTPYYLSPEIVQNKPYSFKSDIWSLGVILYEMCALKMPFEATSLPMLSLKIIRGNYNALPSHYTNNLKNLVISLLSVDTNKRPSINEILRLPILSSRIKNFLSELDFNAEFSHTILHNINILQEKTKKSKLSNFVKHEKSDEDIKVVHKNLLDVIDKNKEKNFYLINKREESNTPQSKRIDVVKKDSGDLPVTKKIDKTNDNKDINNFLAKKKEQIKKNNEGNHEKIIFKTKSNEKEKEGERIIQIQPHLKDFIKKMVKELNQNENDDNEELRNFQKNEEMGQGKEKHSEKDWNDFIHTQKMLVELHQISDSKEENNSVNKSDLEKNISASDLSMDDSFKTFRENSTNEDNLELSELDKKISNTSLKEEDISFNLNNYEVSEFEELRINLEKELGDELFYKLKVIICDKTPIKQLSYDIEILKKAIFQELSKKFNSKTLELALEKIPEIYSIVVKEREKLLGYKV